MKIRVSMFCVALTTVLVASEASVPKVSILSPPDGFFASEGTLEVTVAYESPGRSGGLSLKLLVNGLEVETVRPTGGNGTGAHVFQVLISGPIALVQVISSRGRGGGLGGVAAVRGAGLVEFQRLRATMEEMEEISVSIRGYRDHLNYPVPEDLAVLVPAFLTEVPPRSPLGPPYEYETDGVHFRIRVPLPGQGEVVMEDGTFIAFPPGAITDREAARLIREQLTKMASAVESFRVDNNVYPQGLEDVVPVFLASIPPADPYGNAYLAELGPEDYRLVSLGRDGEQGGAAFDADTIMETGVFLAGSSSYRGQREYMDKALRDLSFLSRAISFSAQRNDHFPESLSDLEEFVGRGASFDLCGNPYRYQTWTQFEDEQVFFLSSNGCDGGPQTDATERETSGFHPPRCAGVRPLLFPLPYPGLFD